MTDIANYEAKRRMLGLFDEQCEELVKNVCGALDNSERATEMIERYLYDLKLKKRKDINAPTKPRSSYLFWTESVRAKLKEANPELDMPGMSKKMGELWKSLTDADKKQFVDAADNDKLRYAEEKEKYDIEICSKTSCLKGSGSQNAVMPAETPASAEATH
jgi:hypothetical protein